ncbi:MAG: DUF3365 domain-containing protein [Thermotogae bacterium]|nr:DUF3365 domain-containing protein [Thermotogota bacterium]
MKRLFLLLGLPAVLLLSLTASKGSKTTEEKVVEIGHKATMNLLKKLLGEVTTSLEEKGAAATIRYCSERAYPLTDSISKALGVKIKRTTFKYRNPKNKPDKYEEEALRYFEKFFKEGKKPPKYYVQKIERNGELVYRYYFPLKVLKLCLTCHGTVGKDVDPKLYEVIKETYPEDKATGYKEGDFRGVVRVEIPAERVR